MSDEEVEYNEEGEDEEEEEEEEGEEGEDEEDEAAKKEKVSTDLALIQDIFSHIECTSRRITESLLLKEELKAAAETIKTIEASQSSSGNRYSDPSDYGDEEAEIEEEESVTWSQYEELDEARRAKLLEKSLMLLAGGSRSSPHRNENRPRGGKAMKKGKN